MQLDFNLLRALDALLEEGSVAGAADRLHLSQPAMSRTLARIRAATGDGILVRSGRVMVPTPYALGVRDDVHMLVEQINNVLSPARELVLDELTATFTLRCHDLAINALAPRLVARAQREAPGVRLRFLAESDSDGDGLRAGTTDAEVTSDQGRTADIASQLLGSQTLVVVMRAGHPLAGNTLTRRRYVNADHVLISRRGRLEDPIDQVLQGHGETRTVIATAPTIASALRIVRDTDALAAIPADMAQADISAFDLITSPLPFELANVPVVMRWHVRNDGDPAHRWLRATIAEILSA